MNSIPTDWTINLLVYAVDRFVDGGTFQTNSPDEMERLGKIVSGQIEVPELRRAKFSFIHEAHLKGFVKCAANENLYISVRETGSDTLARLPNGFACKPHDILDKTLKRKSIEAARPGLGTLTSAWTSRQTQTSDQWVLRGWPGKRPASFDNGVASTLKNSFEVKTKEDIDKMLSVCGHALADALGNTAYSGLVGWWFTIELVRHSEGGGVAEVYYASVPIGVLSVGQKPEREFAIQRDGVGNAFNASPPADSYTGDYDMHCVFSGEHKWVPHESPQGLLCRPATAPSERPQLASSLLRLIEKLNRTYLLDPPYSPDDIRRRNVVKYPTGEPQTNPATDRYAYLIQHGPQNMYYSYVRASSIDVNYLKEKTAQLEGLSDDGIPVVLSTADARAVRNAVHHGREFLVSSLLSMDTSGVLAFSPVKERTQRVYILPDAVAVKKYYDAEGLHQEGWTDGKGEELAIEELFPDELKEVLRQLKVRSGDAVKTRLGLCNDTQHKDAHGTPGLKTQWAAVVLRSMNVTSFESWAPNSDKTSLPPEPHDPGDPGGSWNMNSPLLLTRRWFERSFKILFAALGTELDLNGERIVATRTTDLKHATQTVCFIASCT